MKYKENFVLSKEEFYFFRERMEKMQRDISAMEGSIYITEFFVCAYLGFKLFTFLLSLYV